MPLYENVFIARQDVSSQQVDTMTEEFTKLVADNGGEVAKTEYWGVRGLTYRIKKNRKGHYVLMNLDAPSDAVLELERNMRIHEDVIRYMTVRVEELEEGPSAMMQSRGGRGGRGERGERGDRGERGGRDRDDRPRREDQPEQAGGENAEKSESTASAESVED
ncbi:MAG: 30S ribosomal protein S6 [Rhodospirillaceae bacterium]|mgnify:CR=1 FL=1|nr:30S ribosomal protein S6 [Rhodospirillaceae bacterium]MBT4490922.1 30S ribosomal protein S6 [Rhodospirillaceae bacterium]MBT5193727.1 30S ribosomal protein S6 [Rhodospirillaceae bacterium]MBT5896540.1 30S ribosomal protein S6 [Rhodospirillaceae bacterium]MBT6426385.1 30S ribosomal protein S6 [Rhodospirillaceae bacterium]